MVSYGKYLVKSTIWSFSGTFHLIYLFVYALNRLYISASLYNLWVFVVVIEKQAFDFNNMLTLVVWLFPFQRICYFVLFVSTVVSMWRIRLKCKLKILSLFWACIFLWTCVVTFKFPANMWLLSSVLFFNIWYLRRKEKAPSLQIPQKLL